MVEDIECYVLEVDVSNSCMISVDGVYAAVEEFGYGSHAGYALLLDWIFWCILFSMLCSCISFFRWYGSMLLFFPKVVMGMQA